MEKLSVTVEQIEQLKKDNKLLLIELEEAYKNMEEILLQSEREKEIAYKELEIKYQALQNAYGELSQKENMLIHMEKLSSIGAFITEIVHELKNPLMIISAAAEFALLSDISGKPQKMLSQIPEQVQRMSGMLGRFKAMAYKENENYGCFDINANIRDFLSTLELIKPKMITVYSKLSENELPVFGDMYQITQIYMNLAKNAFDAMEGMVNAHLKVNTFSIKSSHLQTESVEYSCLKKDSWQSIMGTTDTFAVIEFSDNGPGILKENMEYLFDSFYTTKERGKGTGLGLAIADDIAKKHHANITVTSAPQQGTTFKIFIPLADQKNTLNELVDADQKISV